MTTPIQTLCDCIKYCEEQNGMSLCKNCGLSPEMIRLALIESYDRGETAGLAGKEEKIMELNKAWLEDKAKWRERHYEDFKETSK